MPNLIPGTPGTNRSQLLRATTSSIGGYTRAHTGVAVMDTSTDDSWRDRDRPSGRQLHEKEEEVERTARRKDAYSVSAISHTGPHLHYTPAILSAPL